MLKKGSKDLSGGQIFREFAGTRPSTKFYTTTFDQKLQRAVCLMPQTIKLPCSNNAYYRVHCVDLHGQNTKRTEIV